jgi:hypothetical protein
MRMGELKRGAGSKFFLKNYMDESDKGEEMNPMESVSNNGEKKSIFFFYTCGVIL